MAKRIKLTRKSYKRNIIVFGLMLFMGIALISTGFATWVLSQDTTLEQGGNVEVGIVKDNALEISDVKYYTVYNGAEATDNVVISKDELAYYFEPKADDKEGYVKAEFDEHGALVGNAEQMTLYIVGKVSPMNFIDDFNVSLTFGDEAQTNQINAAVAAGYIKLPACAAVGGVNIMQDGNITDQLSIDDEGNFVIKVAFEWGEKFNYQNPGEYYDSGVIDQDPDKKAEAYANMKITLNNLRQLIHGEQLDGEGNVIPEEGSAPEFKITLTVTAK